MTFNHSILAIGLATLVSGLPAMAETIDFEDLSVPPSGYFNGDPGGLMPGDSVSTPWASGGVDFSNTFGIDADYFYEYWNGFAYSNQSVVVNGSDPGRFSDQYQSFPGTGTGGSSNYAIAYAGSAAVIFSAPSTIDGFMIANTAYSALTMRNGDEYMFTSPLADEGWFRTTATGKLGGLTTGSVDFYLADLQGMTPPGILSTWAWFDLSSLGAVDRIEFTFDGSDRGDYGLNTPAYFAMDNLTVSPVPEPGTWAIGAGAVLVTIGMRWRARRAK